MLEDYPKSLDPLPGKAVFGINSENPTIAGDGFFASTLAFHW